MKKFGPILAILLCAAVAEAQLSVSLNLGDNPTIEVQGQVIDKLRRDQLGDVLSGSTDLEKRVRKLRSHCGSPDGIHLSDDDGLPKKLKGTFAKYRWKPATLTLRAQAARIVALTSKPVIVADQECGNPSHVKAFECFHEISRTVENSISREAHWDVSSTVTQTVSYEVGGDAAGGKVGGSTSLSFTAGYGESTGMSESVTVGSTSGAKTTLDPGESVILQLSLTKGDLEAQVDYLRTVSGGVFYRYAKRCDGHYLWYSSLSKLYKPAELREVQSETLRVDAYSHAKVQQIDPP